MSFSGHLCLTCCGKCLLEVGEDVVDVLDSDGEADVAFGRAGLDPLGRVKLAVGGRGRVDRQAARVADVGDIVEELQRVDEAATGVTPRGKFKADKSAKAAAQIGFSAFAGAVGLQTGIDDIGDFGAFGQPVGDLRGVRGMTVDPQRQGFKALRRKERVEGRDRGTEVAQNRVVGEEVNVEAVPNSES